MKQDKRTQNFVSAILLPQGLSNRVIFRYPVVRQGFIPIWIQSLVYCFSSKFVGLKELKIIYHKKYTP